MLVAPRPRALKESGLNRNTSPLDHWQIPAVIVIRSRAHLPKQYLGIGCVEQSHVNASNISHYLIGLSVV